jgi:VWFA-related protein
VILHGTRPRLIFRIAAILCAALVFPIPNQAIPNPAAPGDKDDNEVKFSSRTDLVLIPVLVTDKSGKHITGLKQEDFVVKENGAEQKVASFEEITSDAHRLSRSQNPEEFTNLGSSELSPKQTTLIVLDFINTPFISQTFARQELIKYLEQSIDAREPTALYTLTRDGIHVIHDFTSDPQILAAALHQVRGDAYQMVDSDEDVEVITGTASPDGSSDDSAGGGSSASSSKWSEGSRGSAQSSVQAETAKLQSMLEDAELNFQSFQQRLAITYTLDGLQQIAQAVAGIPGRKALIWASGGFPFSVSDTTMQLAPAGRDTLSDVYPMYEHTWQLLNNAQIALYPVDVNGLQVTTVPSASLGNPGRNFGRHASWRQLDTQGTFEIFASTTGGRAYFNSNDLARGFREAVNDSSQYYIVGYYLDHSKTRPGWRKLAVKVKREHMEVRSRSGFFVTSATVDPEKTRNSDISSALSSPLDYSSLALVARWGKIEPAKEPEKRHVIYKLHLSPEARIIHEADNNHIDLDIVALALAANGKRAGQPVGQKVDIHLTAQKAAAIQRDGLQFTNVLDLAPGNYSVRFVVRDSLSGRTGSVMAPLKVE